ncbi:hypothetical protein IL306_004562 [Fusarium sp. DS 682]|nr:hypothetical protein IL306_004562 [Fusarium sp. DS 682]
MAVLPGVPGIEARIVVNGKPAQEWPMKDKTKRPVDAKDSKAPITANYVESASQCRFAIRLTLGAGLMAPSSSYKLPEATDVIGFRVTIDGVYFATFGVDLTDHSPYDFEYAIVKMPNGTLERKYPVFSNIVSVEEADSDKIKADMARVQNMGTIHIVAYAMRETTEAMEYSGQPDSLPGMELAHKATILHGPGLTHGTTYKNEPVNEADRQSPHPFSVSLATLGEFLFRYGANRKSITQNYWASLLNSTGLVEGKNGFELPETLPFEPGPRLLTQRKYNETKMANGTPLLDLTGDDD